MVQWYNSYILIHFLSSGKMVRADYHVFTNSIKRFQTHLYA